MISVIIPNYNHAHFLQQRIDSVINQTYKEFEVIILDDCSTDKSQQIIEHYREHPKISQIILNNKNSGSTFRQWKKGLAAAQGEYVWIAESDDFSDPDFLKTLNEIIQTSNDIALAYCQSYHVDKRGIIIESRESYTSDFRPNIWEHDFVIDSSLLLNYLIEKNIIPNVSACLLKKQSILGIINENPDILNFKRCGDWYLWFLLCKQDNYRVAFTTKHLNYFRRRDKGQLTGIQKQNTIFEQTYILSKAAQLSGTNPLIIERNLSSLKTQWFRIVRKNKSLKLLDMAAILNITKLRFLLQFIYFNISDLIKR